VGGGLEWMITCALALEPEATPVAYFAPPEIGICSFYNID
jgi:hypothetical protein